MIYNKPNYDYFAFNWYELTTERNQFPISLEVVAHLKLLKAFQVLQRKVVPNIDDKEGSKIWQVFVTNACRRFLIYISALKFFMFDDTTEYYPLNEKSMVIAEAQSKIELNIQLVQPVMYKGLPEKKELRKHILIMNLHLPPLDVIMVWHAFTLNPKSFYDTFLRNNFLRFVFIPFPLHNIDKSIDNVSFTYNPAKKYIAYYDKILKSYGVDMGYFFDKPFEYNQMTVPVFCPLCRVQMCEVPLSTTDNRGFADHGFQTQVSCCKKGELTHEELRRRQAEADILGAKPLPYVHKYFSSWINGVKQDPQEISAVIKLDSLKYLKQLSTSLLDFINCGKKLRILQRRKLFIFRNYFQANLIHLTFPWSSVIEVHEDLVGCVVRQGKFVSKMNEFDWINAPILDELIGESIFRYHRFLNMLMDYGSTTILVPTLDIDLVWHTHQLSTFYYFVWCLDKSKDKRVIDHDDKFEETILDQSFTNTCKLYTKRYGLPYSVCCCWYCVCVRSNSQSKMQKLFGSSKIKPKNMEKDPPPYISDSNMTHISSHNAISLPLKGIERRQKQIKRKYDDRGLPWLTEQGYYNSHPTSFVVFPTNPISVDVGKSCYPSGICCSDIGRNSGGGGGGGASCVGATGASCGNGGCGDSSGGGCGGGGCGGSGT